MEKAILWILEYGNTISVVGMTLALAALFLLALHREWLVIGKYYHRERTKAEIGDKLLTEVNERLTEQRILNAATAAKLSALQTDCDSRAARIRELEVDLARTEGLWESVQRPPSRQRQRS